jgi:hypothetical protein
MGSMSIGLLPYKRRFLPPQPKYDQDPRPARIFFFYPIAPEAYSVSCIRLQM